MPTNAFGIDGEKDKKANAAEFDIDNWISGAKKPERSVTIYRDGSAYADFEQAHEEYNHLSQQRVTRDEAQGAQGEASLADEDTYDAQLEAIVDRMQDAYERCTADELVLRFRANATRDDAKRLMARYAKEIEKDDQTAYYHLAAKCYVGQRTSASTWKKMRAAIGDGQWVKIMQAIDGACFSTDVKPDFSLPLSVLRPIKTPSQS